MTDFISTRHAQEGKADKPTEPMKGTELHAGLDETLGEKDKRQSEVNQARR